jgi:hypothetical protein
MNKNLLAMVAGALLAGPMAANAIPMHLDATSNVGHASNFSVDFSDTGDGLLQLNEITAFSGVTITNLFGTNFWNTIVSVPEVPGFTTFGCATVVCEGPAFWAVISPSFPGVFIHSSGSNFSYSLSATSVPEPGTLSLLAMGFLGLGLMRRRGCG